MAHVRRKFVDALNTAYRLLQVVYKSFKGIIAIQWVFSLQKYG